MSSIDGARMERIMNVYALAFFDKYLRGQRLAPVKNAFRVLS